MSHPSLNTARDFLHRHDLDGVLIVSFSGGKFAVTTYGKTVKQCSALKPLNEAVWRSISSGRFGLDALLKLRPTHKANADSYRTIEDGW